MNDEYTEKRERWLAGEEDSQTEQFERDVLGDPALADEIYAAIELKEALGEAAIQIRIERVSNTRKRLLAWTTCLAAAVMAFVLVLPEFQNPIPEVSPRLRGSGELGSVVGIEPSGEIDHFPRNFSWRPANGEQNSSYRWELYDAKAMRRAVAVVSDTTIFREANLTPADSVGTWLWLVVELKSNGLEGATSPAIHFSVNPEEKH